MYPTYLQGIELAPGMTEGDFLDKCYRTTIQCTWPCQICSGNTAPRHFYEHIYNSGLVSGYRLGTYFRLSGLKTYGVATVLVQSKPLQELAKPAEEP